VHSAICTGENGQTTGFLNSRVRDETGNSTIRETTFQVDLCNSPDAGADCDIFNSGKLESSASYAELTWICSRIFSLGMARGGIY
jgi:hypothetical protein